MKIFKKTVIAFLIVLLVMLGASALFLSYLLKPNEIVEYKTDYGDTFGIWYDGFQVKTSISDNNSRFSITVKGEVEGKDIIGLANNSDLKVYMVKDIIFYDEGNGFELFNRNTNNQMVIGLAKENLPSGKFDKIMSEKSKRA